MREGFRGVRWTPLVLVLAASCPSSGGGSDPGDGTRDAGADPGTADDGPAADGGPDAVGDVPTDAPHCTADCGAMVPVAAASYTMGCAAGAAASACAADEKPAHVVDVPAFEIDATEVTAGEWARCHDDGACGVPNSSSDLCTYGVAGKEGNPVNCIEWAQADAYCRWAGKRLCTEAEWELAAVGTDGRTYPWGEEAPTCDRAVVDDGVFGCGTGATFAAGSKPAGDSPCGASDMLGNVWEWVQDFYHDTYAGAPTDGSAWMDPPTEFRMARGGAFSDKPQNLRASIRRKFDLRLDGYYLGVRCCRQAGTP